jgi:hypothetical protein
MFFLNHAALPGSQAALFGLPRGLAFGLSTSLDVCHKVERHAKLQAFA